MGIVKYVGKAVVVAGCLSALSGVAHAGYDENVGAASDSSSMNHSSMSASSMNRSEMRMQMRMRNSQMLIQTLSEEKTEINALAAQREMFLKMGGTQNRRIASMYGRWIKEHKAGGPTFMRLIRANGGNPMDAKILKAPVLGSAAAMLMATHKDHQAAVMGSQMRYSMTMSPAIKAAMHKRANLARKHLAQMAPYHSMMMNGEMMNNGMMNDGMSSDTSMDDSSTTKTTTTTVTTNTTTDTSATDANVAGNDTKGADGAGAPDATTTDSAMATDDSTMTQ